MPSERNWTPGPWTHIYSNQGVTGIVAFGKGEVRFYGVNSKEDAKLFMAAPDLYEALKKSVSDLHNWNSLARSCPGAEYTASLIRECEGVLAKARGEKTDADQ